MIPQQYRLITEHGAKAACFIDVWEYSGESIPAGQFFHKTLERLNVLGQEGWELVYMNGSQMVLKRLVPFQETFNQFEPKTLPDKI